MSDFNSPQIKKLRMAPHAVAALFISIAGCESGWAFGIPGIIVGAIGFYMARKAQAAMYQHPDTYRGNKIIQAALTWSIVAIVQGIILTVVFLLYFVFIFSIVGSSDSIRQIFD